MSFLECIGNLMAGSGLEELLQKVYADNAVKHMLSVKAIARAIRGHFLVDAALNTMLVASEYNVPLPQEVELSNQLSEEEEEEKDQQSPSSFNDLSKARQLINEILEGDKSMGVVLASRAIDAISKKVDEEKRSMKDQRTTTLWLQYMDMIDILRQFIKAEQTGNWLLHMQSVQNMLPFFAAAGHHHYTKSAHLYFQMMAQLRD